MEIIKNITSEKKDLINAANSTVGFKDIVGTPVKMIGAIIYKKEEKNAKTDQIEIKTVVSIKKENGEFVSTVSPTILQSLEMVLESYSEEEVKAGIDILVKSKKSGVGREFLYIELA